jgi:hypothetical protein
LKAGIIAFAFGMPWAIPPNKTIAEIASKRARELHAPIYTQGDIHIDNGIEVEYINQDIDNPPPTLCIARGAVQWAKQRGFNYLLIVAAKPHLWRVVRDVKKAIREAGAKIEVQTDLEIEDYPENNWFCPTSRQERTRSKVEWNKRERILKLLPFCIYKIVAK